MNENLGKDLDPEVEKLSLEHEKIELEREKLSVERYKARWTALSIAIPVVVAIITFGYSSYLENRRSEAEFRLKAFEVLLSNPAQTNVKAGMMRDLFPSFEISDKVLSNLNAYGTTQNESGLRMDMFRTYANSNRKKWELVTAYNQLFPTNPVTGKMVPVPGVDYEVVPPPNNPLQRRP